MARATVTIRNIDTALLQQQARALAEIARFIRHGETSERADEWPAAIEGLENLIAEVQARAALGR